MELTPVNDPIVLGECNSNPASFSSSTIFPSQSPSGFLIKHLSYAGDLSWIKTVENVKDFRINPLGNIYTWSNVIGWGFATSGWTFLFSKYSSDGTFVYTQRQGGSASSMGFGNNNDFFFTGYFRGTVQMGATTLTSYLINNGEGNIFVSHWME
jgi:hypothetical protein